MNIQPQKFWCRIILFRCRRCRRRIYWYTPWAIVGDSRNKVQMSLELRAIPILKACFLPWPWNRQRRKIKNKTVRQTRWLHLSNSQLSPGAIFHHLQRMKLTFHNSYVILELVPSTMIFWTELSCWRWSYSNKATLLLGCNIATKFLRSSSQSDWLLQNIHISSGNGSFTLYVDVFFPRSLLILLPDLTVYMSNTEGDL